MVTDAMRFLEGVLAGARSAVERGVRSVRGGAARPVLPLVFVLASRNLFQDRVRLIATVVGIVFSIILVTVQIGLFLSFERMVTTMIDHAEADLWIMPRGTKCFEDPSLLDERERFRALSIPGVTEAVPLVIGFAEWKLPNGGATPVFVVGSDENSAGLQPWNIIAGSLDQLATPDAVAVDQSYFERLGVSGLGDVAEMRDRKAKVAVITRGIRSFTTTPYVFTSFDRARSYIGISPNKATYFLVRVSPNYDLESVRRQIADNATDTEVLTSEEFRVRSRSFWLFGTGAGAALFAGALLGIIVGTVIVAQTLYSSTKDHLKEFATLRAIGSSSIYIVKVILWQALLSAVIGFCIAAAIGLLIVQMTADTALPVVMTPELMVGLFVLTLVMCAVSAISAILEVMRMDPAMVFAR
ncbi:MAG: ABC transporter permease [Rhodoplanes sp.]